MYWKCKQNFLVMKSTLQYLSFLVYFGGWIPEQHIFIVNIKTPFKWQLWTPTIPWNVVSLASSHWNIHFIHLPGCIHHINEAAYQKSKSKKDHSSTLLNRTTCKNTSAPNLCLGPPPKIQKGRIRGEMARNMGEVFPTLESEERPQISDENGIQRLTVLFRSIRSWTIFRSSSAVCYRWYPFRVFVCVRDSLWGCFFKKNHATLVVVGLYRVNDPLFKFYIKITLCNFISIIWRKRKLSKSFLKMFVMTCIVQRKFNEGKFFKLNFFRPASLKQNTWG